MTDIILNGKLLTRPGLALLDVAILGYIQAEGQIDSNARAGLALADTPRSEVSASLRKLHRLGLITDCGPGSTIKDRTYKTSIGAY